MHRLERLRLLVMAAHRDTDRAFAGRLRQVGVTAAQAEALKLLEEHRHLAVRDLGDLLVREAGSPSRLAGTMAEHGWAEKAPQDFDGRVTILRITSRGLRRANRVRTAERRLYESMDDDHRLADLEACEDVLHALSEGPSGRAVRSRLRGGSLLPW